MPRGRSPRNPNYLLQEEALAQLGGLPLEQIHAIICEILLIKQRGEIRFYQTQNYVGVTLDGRVVLRLYAEYMDWAEFAPDYARDRHPAGSDQGDQRRLTDAAWIFYRHLVQQRDDGAA